MPTKRILSRLASTVAAGVLLATLPAAPGLGPNGATLQAPYAFAKDGRDDDSGKGGGKGGKSDDKGGDDHGGSGGGGKGSGRSGGDDSSGRGSDDNSGRGHGRGSDDADDSRGGHSGRGGDDDGSDDRGSDDRGSDDHHQDDRGSDDHRSDDGGGHEIEVVNSDGTKVEIHDGVFERKDASGRTIEERRATQADVSRLRGLTKTATPRATSRESGREIRVGWVTSVEAEGRNVEVRYSSGWKEELVAGRYELKDPDNNTVVERSATTADIGRLTRLAGN